MRLQADPGSGQTLANTIDEAARKSRISRSELYKLMQGGRLRYLKNGRRRLITDEALIELLHALEAETAAAKAAHTQPKQGIFP